MEGLAVKGRQHRSVISLEIERRMAEAIEPDVVNPSMPMQLDLFDPGTVSLKTRRGRPRTARLVYSGSNRRGYRSE